MGEGGGGGDVTNRRFLKQEQVLRCYKALRKLTTFWAAYSFHPSGPYLTGFDWETMSDVTKVGIAVVNTASRAITLCALGISNRGSDVMINDLIAIVVFFAICAARGCMGHERK